MELWISRPSAFTQRVYGVSFSVANFFAISSETIAVFSSLPAPILISLLQFAPRVMRATVALHAPHVEHRGHRGNTRGKTKPCRAFVPASQWSAKQLCVLWFSSCVASVPSVLISRRFPAPLRALRGLFKLAGEELLHELRRDRDARAVLRRVLD